MKHFWIIAICCVIVTECQLENIEFPENFTIGAATSSYQIEGGWNASDKGENCWDHFTHNKPQYIQDGSNGDIACDSYNKYQEDVNMLGNLGVDFYRFSISWSRILPTGFADKVSEDGIQYYKNLIAALRLVEVEPVVTIYHWDHPQILEEMGGWTNEMMVEWYADYARIIFQEFGPLVKSFVTINEPNIFCSGYNSVGFTPGKALENMGQYICVHNALKAHAKAYHIYDEEFRPTQQGEIGLVASCGGWVSGNGTSDASIDQAFQFNCGWIMHPIYIGDYPEIMKTRIAMISKLEGWPFSRLPEFSEEWIDYIRGTSDFFGVNHYSSYMPIFDPDEELGIYNRDNGIINVVDESWQINHWIYIVPTGFSNLLRLIKDNYGNPPVYVYENGYSDNGELNDYDRINYYYEYVKELLVAVHEDGCNVQRYTIWSLLDNYEWTAGYTKRFGVISVDFDSPDRTRTFKLSTYWWQQVIQTRQLRDVPTSGLEN